MATGTVSSARAPTTLARSSAAARAGHRRWRPLSVNCSQSRSCRRLALGASIGDLGPQADGHAHGHHLSAAPRAERDGLRDARRLQHPAHPAAIFVAAHHDAAISNPANEPLGGKGTRSYRQAAQRELVPVVGDQIDLEEPGPSLHLVGRASHRQLASQRHRGPVAPFATGYRAARVGPGIGRSWSGTSPAVRPAPGR